jgi:hypothetical protein
MGRLSVYINSETEAVFSPYVDRYGSISAAVSAAITSLDTIDRRERPALENIFTENELRFLTEIVRPIISPQAVPGIFMSSALFQDKEIFEARGIDRKEFLKKIETLALSQEFALAGLVTDRRNAKKKQGGAK